VGSSETFIPVVIRESFQNAPVSGGVKDYLKSTRHCHPIMHPRETLGRGNRRRLFGQVRKCNLIAQCCTQLNSARAAAPSLQACFSLHDVDHPQRASCAPRQGSAITKLTKVNGRIVLCSSVHAMRRVSSYFLDHKFPTTQSELSIYADATQPA
jgi:hypothetical protein